MATAEQTGGILATLFPQYSTQISNIAKAFTPSPSVTTQQQQQQQQNQQQGGVSENKMLIYGGAGLLAVGLLVMAMKGRS